MKKIAVVGSVLLAMSCSNSAEYKSDMRHIEASTVPCSYSCFKNDGVSCEYRAATPQANKPRVTEIMPKTRPCCDDQYPNAKAVIPDAPEIYVIAANRTLRSMLSNSTAIFKTKSKIFVADTINNEPDMPTGIEKGTEAIKRNITNAENVEVVSDRAEAQYVLTSEVNWFDTPTKTVPAIKYSLGLFDTRGQKLGEWNEILHQAAGDRSWW